MKINTRTTVMLALKFWAKSINILIHTDMITLILIWPARTFVPCMNYYYYEIMIGWAFVG